MSTVEKSLISVSAVLSLPIDKVWDFWTKPNHIVLWNNASDDWHTPKAENDLRVGGKFLSRMEAKDGSMGFDFTGEYTAVEKYKLIAYTMSDGRKASTLFESVGNETSVTTIFEAETENSLEMQKTGWQAILNNFKKYAEGFNKKEKLKFEIRINAPVEKVYSSIIADDTYRKWTAVFNPTSHFKGNWEVGSKMLFIGTDEEGNEGGMVSKVKENEPNQFISVEHLGVYQNGKEITSGPEVEGWAGSHENYIFKSENGSTLVAVELESISSFKEYFNNTFPKALEVLKSICEKQ
jgi:uncharacterized protein YndB with AHSA1/START domain